MAFALHTIKKMNPYIKYFDVSMRDGLQSLSKIYSLQEKQILLNKIMKQYKPHSLEIGSLVSNKLIPQMANSYELYKYAHEKYNDIMNMNMYTNMNMNIKSTINNTCKFYLLVPPTKKYLNIAKNLNIKNISLITSVSEEFQRKNVNQSIQETKDIIKEYLEVPGTFDNVKLYVSCITNCPITGKDKKNKDYIINELYEYLNINGIKEVCISDTCGDMKYEDFKHIIDYLSIDMKYKLDKLSLHLHVKNEYHEHHHYHYHNQDHNQDHNNDDYNTVEKIIEYAIASNIYKFDVSCLENSGGCIITFDDKSKMNGNLTYDKLYKVLYNCNLYT